MFIKKNEVSEFLKETRGRFFTVRFIKRTTGELRVMNCRTGVRQGVTGEGLKFDPEKRGLLVVWDAKIGQHRMVSLDGVQSITFRGDTYNVV